MSKAQQSAAPQNPPPQPPNPATASIQAGVPATIGQNMPHEKFGAYPTDPTNGFADIMKFLQGTADYRYLVHGIYDLIGFVLRLALGDPHESPVTPEIMQQAVTDLQTAFKNNPQRLAALPPWALTVIQQAIQMLFLWWQSRQAPQMMQAQAVPPWLTQLIQVLLTWFMNRNLPAPVGQAPTP